MRAIGLLTLFLVVSCTSRSSNTVVRLLTVLTHVSGATRLQAMGPTVIVDAWFQLPQLSRQTPRQLAKLAQADSIGKPESALWAAVTYPGLTPGFVHGTDPDNVNLVISPGFGWNIGGCPRKKLQDSAEFVDQACATPSTTNAYWFRGYDGQVVAADTVVRTSFERILLPGLQITYIGNPPAKPQVHKFDQAIVDYIRSHTVCVTKTDASGIHRVFDGRPDHQGPGCSDLSTLDRFKVSS